MKYVLSFCFVLIVVFVISVQEIAACSCIKNSTVDITFDKTPNVAVFKLRSVEEYAAGEQGFGVGGIKQAKLTVERVYKGNFKVGDELTFAQGGGADCVWTFGEERVGHEYLFYLGEKPGKTNVWVAGTCSRSGSMESAAADILYLEKRESVRAKSRLSGRLTKTPEAGTWSYEPLPKRKVVVTGSGKKIELVTDSNGVYEAYGLAPGTYSITPEPIQGYRFGSPGPSISSIEVRVAGYAHVETDFWFTVDNKIAGRFFDAKGTPLKNVCVRLRPASGKEIHGLFEMDCTDAVGRFSMDSIPSGTYVLVINEDDKVTADNPFGRFFYPSARKREDAAELTIGPGDFYDNLIINAPETAEVITVTGVLSLEDGKRATDKNTQYVSIEFFADKDDSGRDEKSQPDARSQIDATGRFTIRILKGQRGTLFASMMTYDGKYENCPKMDKLIRQAGKESLPTIKSTEVQIDGGANVADVELKFPFPSCRLRTER